MFAYWYTNYSTDKCLKDILKSRILSTRTKRKSAYVKYLIIFQEYLMVINQSCHTPSYWIYTSTVFLSPSAHHQEKDKTKQISKSFSFILDLPSSSLKGGVNISCLWLTLINCMSNWSELSSCSLFIKLSPLVICRLSFASNNLLPIIGE